MYRVVRNFTPSSVKSLQIALAQDALANVIIIYLDYVILLWRRMMSASEVWSWCCQMMMFRLSRLHLRFL